MTIKQAIQNVDNVFGGRIVDCACTGPVSYEGLMTTLASVPRPGADGISVNSNRVTFRFKCLGCQKVTTYTVNSIEKRQYAPGQEPPREV